MRRVTAIFKKDVRHLWPQIVTFWALLLLAALLDPTYTHRRSSPAESLLWVVLPLACWNLVIAAIHGEPLLGDRQFWLTRPYTRVGLAAAKGLFIVVFVNLPVFATHAAIFGGIGMQPFDHWSALLWRQVFLTSFVVLPAAALAAVTSNLRQAIMAALLVLAALTFLTAASFSLRYPELFMHLWVLEYWPARLLTAAVAIPAAALVLFLQYSRRTVVLSRALFAGVVVIAVMIATLTPRDKEFAVRTILSARQSSYPAVGVVLNPGSGRPTDPLYRRERRIPSIVHVEIPVRIDGVPTGLDVLTGRLAETVLGTSLVYSEMREAPPGKRWLSIDIDAPRFERVKHTPVDLDGSIKVTLFAPVQTVPAPASNKVVVGAVGVCASRLDPEGPASIECYTPFPRAALAVQFPGGGRQWLIDRLTADAPLPSAVSFQPIERHRSQVTFSMEELSNLHLVTEQPVAHIRPRLNLKGIRLGDYAYPKAL